MIHFSCDRCKRVLDPDDDLRYVVKLEVHAAMEPVDADDLDDDRDHLLEIHEMLESVEDLDNELTGDDAYQRRRYDLCSECYRKFMKSPLGREPVTQLDFSQN